MADFTEPDLTSQTLGQAFSDFLEGLRAGQRTAFERYVRHYVQSVGEDLPAAAITGPRLESYAEATIKTNDPAAEERVAALKAWFLFLKRRHYTSQNFGTVIRVRRSLRSPGSVGRSTRADQAPLEVTWAGLESMQRELEELQKEVPSLIDSIAKAREDKDFRENAPLDAAREALAQNESRRKQLAADLRRARVTDQTDSRRAAVGSSVAVTRLDTGATASYQLVGAREANAREGKISVESPVGRELLGKAEGDEVTVKTPNGEIGFRVDTVKAAPRR